MVKVKEKEVCVGYDCWGRREYETFYVVVDDNNKEVFRSKNNPTELINMLTK